MLKRLTAASAVAALSVGLLMGAIPAANAATHAQDTTYLDARRTGIISSGETVFQSSTVVQEFDALNSGVPAFITIHTERPVSQIEILSDDPRVSSNPTVVAIGDYSSEVDSNSQFWGYTTSWDRTYALQATGNLTKDTPYYISFSSAGGLLGALSPFKYYYSTQAPGGDWVTQSTMLYGSVQVTPIVDTTPPTATVAYNPASPDGNNGWYTSYPTATFTCSDPSGVSSCPDPITATTDSASWVPSGTATDTLSNSGTVSGEAVKIDTTPPTIADFSYMDGLNYSTSNLPAQTCVVEDTLSGPDTCVVTVDSALTTPGSHTVTATATDLAGNKTVSAVNVTTSYPIVPPVIYTSSLTLHGAVKGNSVTVNAGAKTTLTSELSLQRTCVLTSVACAGSLNVQDYDVTLWATLPGGKPQQVASKTTVGGVVSFDVSPTKTTVYQTRFAGFGRLITSAASTSRVPNLTVRPSESPNFTVNVSVKPPVNMVVATVNKASVKRGHQVTIAASTIPSEAKLTIKLQKLVGGSWLTFAKTVTDKSGKHSFKWSTITPGTYQMRVVVVGFGVSNTVSFKVTK